MFIVGRSVEQGRVAGLFSLLGIHAVAIGLVTDGAYALAAGSAGNWLKRRRGFLQVERYATGALLVGLGVTAALAGNQRKQRAAADLILPPPRRRPAPRSAGPRP